MYDLALFCTIGQHHLGFWLLLEFNHVVPACLTLVFIDHYLTV